LLPTVPSIEYLIVGADAEAVAVNMRTEASATAAAAVERVIARAPAWGWEPKLRSGPEVAEHHR
jgi:hypothetical protein